MRIVKSKTIEEYWTTYRDAEGPLTEWLNAATEAEWTSIQDIRLSYPSADAAKAKSGRDLTIFNIKGNTYRLIVAIHYQTKIVFIREFLTHAEYSKNLWKDRH